ncbi:MAG: ABC transporter ATP-binding protein [Bacteroidia bacterium]|nr:ABC transporter ATP-binding protein [Bacteroidia bacterium]
MKLLFSYLKNHWALVILALLLAAINQCFSLADPYIGGKIMNRFATLFTDTTTERSLPVFFNKIIFLLLASMGVAMVSRIAKNFQDYFTNVIIQRTGAKMYTDGIKHSLELPYHEFEDQRSGETLGKIQKMRSDSEKFITSFVNVVFQSLVGVVFVVVYAIRVHWVIAPLFLLTVPVLGVISSLLSKKIKTVSKTILGETTALAGSTTESLRNIELVKSLGLTQQEIGRLNTVTEKILKLELNKVKYIRSLSFVQGTAVNFLRTCLVFMLYFLVFRGQINIGEVFTLMLYSFFIFGPLQELGNVIAIYRETQASLQNFETLMNKSPEPKPAHPVKLGSVNSLSFNEVVFRHQSAGTNAVDGISFEIKTGETIAFVGPSGSGKTTLVKLLVGLYRPVSGAIKYNNIPEQDIDIYELRRQIGFVSQDTQLFSGTIKENLLFVNPSATDAECMDALNKAACQNLLARATNGIETVIGEGGIKVSGGEKQRLSIARALLRKPHLIIFDEATSALDSLTEEEITKTIRDVSGGEDRITVMIAHRLSTIMHADRIFVLERGRIIESGKHDELLKQMGLYHAMWRQQIGERHNHAMRPAKVLN